MKLILLLFSLIVLPFESVVGQNSIHPLDFKLKSTDGSLLQASNYPEAKGFILVFTCNHCPFAKLYTERLNKLHDTYARQGIPLIAINSMDTLVYEDESFVLMVEKAKSAGFHFPYVQDQLQIAAKYFKAAHTPQAFVVWKTEGEWKIRYSGAIDDNGEAPEKAKSYIVAALEELIATKEVSLPKTASFGCKIYYRN